MVAIAVGGLVAHGVAAAAPDDSLSWMQGRCTSEDYDVVPCDGNEMAKVLKVAP